MQQTIKLMTAIFLMALFFIFATNKTSHAQAADPLIDQLFEQRRNGHGLRGRQPLARLILSQSVLGDQIVKQFQREKGMTFGAFV